MVHSDKKNIRSNEIKIKNKQYAKLGVAPRPRFIWKSYQNFSMCFSFSQTSGACNIQNILFPGPVMSSEVGT